MVKCPHCSREVSQGTIYGKKSEKKAGRQMWWDKQNERIKMQIREWLKENTKNEMYNVQRNR